MDEVLRYSQKNDYQLACTKHFELVNDHNPNEVINNPVRYYELCRIVDRNKAKRDTSVQDNSMSLYDKHLWEMTTSSSVNELNDKQVTVDHADAMSQYDLNF